LQQLLLASCRSPTDDVLLSVIKANCSFALIKAVKDSPACELLLHLS
jgi:hypothetical protein